MTTPLPRNPAIHTDACNAAHAALPLSGDAARDLPLVQAMADCHALSDSHLAARLARQLAYELATANQPSA